MLEQYSQPIQNTQTIAGLCSKWYKLTRKTRREHNWSQLLNPLFAWIFPDIKISSLLISQDDMFENFQLLLSASFTYMEKEANAELMECPATDLLLLLQGKIAYQDHQRGKWLQIHSVESINSVGNLFSKNQKTVFRMLESSTLMKCEKKLIDKFKNDILRQDRENKENFLSNYLFCNFTPVYSLPNVSIAYISEGCDVELKPNAILILHAGLVKRKNRQTKKCVGTELTRGCLLSYRLLASIVQKSNWFNEEEEEIMQAKQDCTILVFELEQMQRILKLNAPLKLLLENKLKTLAAQRQLLNSKSIEVQAKFAQSFKQNIGAIKLTYSIDFKSKPRSANQLARSFRCKPKVELSDLTYAQFITFDKYDKMMESKERVMTRKQDYQLCERSKTPKVSHAPDYEKKLKLQNKMMRIQSGKIQKISQRDSRADCNPQQIQEIKKNLFQITHLFDEPLKDFDMPIHQTKSNSNSNNKARTFHQLENCLEAHCIARVSYLKPEQFLKNEYLHQFLCKSRRRQSIKDGGENCAQKENMDKTECSFGGKTRKACLKQQQMGSN